MGCKNLNIMVKYDDENHEMISQSFTLYIMFPYNLPDKMKKIPETKARMVRWGRMWPMLLMTKAVKTKSSETIGKGVAVLTISNRDRKTFPQNFCPSKTL